MIFSIRKKKIIIVIILKSHLSNLPYNQDNTIHSIQYYLRIKESNVN